MAKHGCLNFFDLKHAWGQSRAGYNPCCHVWLDLFKSRLPCPAALCFLLNLAVLTFQSVTNEGGAWNSDRVMRVRSAIKRLCDACRLVKRRGRLFVVCKANPKVPSISSQ